MVSASTFPLCPPLCTPQPPAVNHFPPFRATFFGFFLLVVTHLPPKTQNSRKTSRNPQVGYQNAPIPTGAHRHPHRSRIFTRATPHPGPHVRVRRDVDPRRFSNLGSNHCSWRGITGTFIGTKFNRTPTIHQEVCDVSTNRRSWPSSSLTPTRTHRSRRCCARWC